MTHDELTDNGWVPKQCKVGTLYFKDNYFCKLKDDVAVVYSINDDMNPLDEAHTLQDIFDIQKKNDCMQIVTMEHSLELIKAAFQVKYNESYITVYLNELNNGNI